MADTYTQPTNCSVASSATEVTSPKSPRMFWQIKLLGQAPAVRLQCQACATAIALSGITRSCTTTISCGHTFELISPECSYCSSVLRKLVWTLLTMALAARIAKHNEQMLGFIADVKIPARLYASSLLCRSVYVNMMSTTHSTCISRSCNWSYQPSGDASLTD